MNTRSIGLFLSAALVLGLQQRAAHAANADEDVAGPPGPPAEAVEACANQKEGATCTVSFHGKSVEAKCVKGPEGQEPLACMPPPPKPPQEALDACANQKEGATCTVPMHGESVQSKCGKAPGGDGVLVCMPPRHPRYPPKEAIDACASQKDGDTCTATFHGRSLEGTCGKGPGGNDVLACMPLPPPEAIEACAKLAEAAACTVTHHGREHRGTCRNSPSGKGPLACAPAHPPR